MPTFAQLLGQIDDDRARERVLHLAARVHTLDTPRARRPGAGADVEPLLADIFAELVRALRAKRYPLPPRERLRELIHGHFGSSGSSGSSGS